MKEIDQALNIAWRVRNFGWEAAKSTSTAVGSLAVGAVELLTQSNRPKEWQEAYERKRERQNREDARSQMLLDLNEVMHAATGPEGGLDLAAHDRAGWRAIVQFAAKRTLLRYHDEQTVDSILNIINGDEEPPSFPKVLTSADIPVEDGESRANRAADMGGYTLRAQRTVPPDEMLAPDERGTDSLYSLGEQ